MAPGSARDPCQSRQAGNAVSDQTTAPAARVLLAGESWHSYSVHQKGFNAYYTSAYDEGHQPLSAALRASGFELAYLPNHQAVRDFPRTLDALQAWDVVILSDIGSDTLLLHPETFGGGRVSGDPLSALRDWVGEGGGLLMIGGYLSFTGFMGQARYGMTALADALPVLLMPTDDRVERPDGVAPTVDASVEDFGVLDGIKGPWPTFLGYNRFVARPRTSVPLRVGADPFLVLGEHGAGRVAAFASDCSPHWGSTSFTEWRHYRRFWANLVRWLAGPA